MKTFIKYLLIGVLLMGVTSITLGQKVEKDNKGNYIERSTTKSNQGKNIRRTYTNSKGTVYKVFQESNGKQFIWLMDKNRRYTKYYVQ